NSAANSLTAQTSGLYWLEVDNGACSFRDSVQVTYLSAPQIDLGTDRTLCTGQTLVLNAPAGFTYLWNDNSTGNQLTVSSAGTYWLEASNVQCAARDSIVVSYQNPPSVNLGNDTTLCDDQLISWTFNNPGVSYLWQNNSVANSLTAQTSGLYWLKVDNGACSFRDSIQVTYLSAPQVDLGNDRTLCTGQTLVLTAPAGLTYLWNDNSTGNQLTVSSAGTYWLEASNTNCTVRDSIVVTYQNPPLVNLGNDTTLCDDQLISWTFSNPGFTYLWQNNSGSNTLTAQTSGLYWLEADNGACSFRDSVLITYLSAPQVDLGNDRTLCTGQTLVLNAPAGLTYLWNDNSTGNQLTVTGAGTYWLEASNTNCTVRDSIVVTYQNPPSVSLGNDTILCENETLLLHAASNGNVSYLWNTGSTTSEVLVNQAGIYWVDVSNSACTARDSIELAYQAYPQINLGNDTTLCQPDVLTLSVPNTFSGYLWSNNSTANTINVSQEGRYTVEVEASGCVSKDSIYVSFIEKFSIRTDTTGCLDDELLLHSTYPAGTYLWGDGTSQPYLQVTDPGSYELQFFNICGANEIVFDVAFKNCACYLYIPNTFTPDADEHNPRFEIEYECDFNSFHLEIYDRWGELIFESYDPAVGWDGTYANFGLVQDDVYVWKLYYVDNISLTSTTRVGHVSVIK
ncbi:MAG: gliding motility-associated C-terminal domain-containing protein, partial [Bacteroidota bacterium]